MPPAGGQSYDSLKFGAMESSNHASDLTYNVNGGLGFFDDYIIDTHFAYVTFVTYFLLLNFVFHIFSFIGISRLKIKSLFCYVTDIS